MPIIIHGSNTGGVNSFNGRNRDVMPKAGDYTPAMVGMEDGVLLNKTELHPNYTKTGNISYAFGNGKFVCVHYNSNVAEYSEDGISWTSVVLPASLPWGRVCFGNNKFVCIPFYDRKGNFAYSSDGTTWTKAIMPVDTEGYIDLIYGNGKFIALGVSKICYSTDGLAWTQVDVPATANWARVTCNGTRYLAVAYKSKVGAYSDDGITWTEVTLPAGSTASNTYYLGSFKGMFYFTYSLSKWIYRSSDGISWSSIDTKLSSPDWGWILSNDDILIMTIRKSDKFIYTTDGISFSEGTSPDAEQSWIEGCYGNGKFLLGSLTKIALSSDGINWYSSVSNLTKPSGTDITDDMKSLLSPTALTEDEINSLWESIV